MSDSEPEPRFVDNDFGEQDGEEQLERSRNILRAIVDKGCRMTPDDILDRLTDAIKQDLARQPDGEADIERLSGLFSAHADAETGTLRVPDGLIALLRPRLAAATTAAAAAAAAAIPDADRALQAAARLLHFHAGVPFAAPPSHLTSRALLRAAALVRADAADANQHLTAGDATSSGTAGAGAGRRRGWWVVERDRAPADRLRLLFRGLAVPHDGGGGAADEDDKTLSVPQFEVLERPGLRSVYACAPEPEPRVDVLDVLARTTPRGSRLTARPVRRALAGVAAGLPGYAHPLSELAVPEGDLVAFLGLLFVLEGRKGAEEAARKAADAVRAVRNGEDGWVSWREFRDGVVREVPGFVGMVGRIADVLFRGDGTL